MTNIRICGFALAISAILSLIARFNSALSASIIFTVCAMVGTVMTFWDI